MNSLYESLPVNAVEYAFKTNLFRNRTTEAEFAIPYHEANVAELAQLGITGTHLPTLRKEEQSLQDSRDALARFTKQAAYYEDLAAAYLPQIVELELPEALAIAV